MMLRKASLLLLGFVFLAGCGSGSKAPQSSNPKAKKKTTTYRVHPEADDPANQSSIEDLIYSELSRKQKSMLRKYEIPAETHAVGGVKFDIPIVVNDRVEAWIDYFAYGSGRKHYERWLGRSTRFVPLQLRVIKEFKAPKDLIFLSMIESGFNTHALSTASASGLWQFIKSTGRLYGLESDYWVDERRDPEKASIAAISHLSDLYNEFKDWYLAFAAYNAGAGKVRRAIEATGSRDFWVLASSPYLRQETKDYVPKILAAAIIGKNPQKYGFGHVEFQSAIATEKAKITSPTDLQVIADCAGVDVDLIRLLNPSLIRSMTPLNRPNFEINLPRGTKKAFEAKYARLNASERLKNVRYVVQKGESLRSIAYARGVSPHTILNVNSSVSARGKIPAGTTLLLPRTFDGPPSIQLASSSNRGNRLIDLIAENVEKPKVEKATKKTKEKESRTLIAKREKEEPEELKTSWKEEEQKKPGESLLAMNEKNSVLSSTDASSNSTPTSQSPAVSMVLASVKNPTNTHPDDLSHSAQEGSSLDPKAEKPSSTDTEIEKSLAKLGPSNAEEIKNPKAIPVKSSKEKIASREEKPKIIQHQVRKGESLKSIAARYRTTIAQVKEWNKIKGNAVFANQTLKIYPAGKREEIKSSAREERKGNKTLKTTNNKAVARLISHRVKPGETIDRIARIYSVSPSEIKKMNRLGKKSPIRPGIVLKIRSKEAGSVRG